MKTFKHFTFNSKTKKYEPNPEALRSKPLKILNLNKEESKPTAILSKAMKRKIEPTLRLLGLGAVKVAEKTDKSMLLSSRLSNNNKEEELDLKPIQMPTQATQPDQKRKFIRVENIELRESVPELTRSIADHLKNISKPKKNKFIFMKDIDLSDRVQEQVKPPQNPDQDIEDLAGRVGAGRRAFNRMYADHIAEEDKEESANIQHDQLFINYIDRIEQKEALQNILMLRKRKMNVMNKVAEALEQQFIDEEERLNEFVNEIEDKERIIHRKHRQRQIDVVLDDIENRGVEDIEKLRNKRLIEETNILEMELEQLLSGNDNLLEKTGTLLTTKDLNPRVGNPRKTKQEATSKTKKKSEAASLKESKLIPRSTHSKASKNISKKSQSKHESVSSVLCPNKLKDTQNSSGTSLKKTSGLINSYYGGSIENQLKIDEEDSFQYDEDGASDFS